MNLDTFNFLCTELHPYIQRQTTCLREPISVEKRVAVTVWKLATNVEYRTLSNLFGILEDLLCQLLQQKPAGLFLTNYWRNLSLRVWGFPQVAEAIDGSHVPIVKLQESPSDYYNRKGYYSIYNRKGYYSINVQALVDFRGRFMGVCVGWPGKVHDARVFVNSSLYAKANIGKLFPSWTRRLCGVDVPLVILGDPAYPLLPWLMKPYTYNDHTPADPKNYNY